jgi:putative membrane protein
VYGYGPDDNDGARREDAMLYLITNWFIGALSLMIVAHLIPGFIVRSFGSALIAALVIGLVNATIGLVLKIMTLPLTILTFGLFLFVVNAILLQLAAALVSGFSIDGFFPAILGAVVLTIVHSLLRQLVFA